MGKWVYHMGSSGIFNSKIISHKSWELGCDSAKLIYPLTKLNNSLYGELWKYTDYGHHNSTFSTLNKGDSPKNIKFSIWSLPFQISCCVHPCLRLQTHPLHFWQFQLDSSSMIQKGASSVEKCGKDSNSNVKRLQMFHKCLQLLSGG